MNDRLAEKLIHIFDEIHYTLKDIEKDLRPERKPIIYPTLDDVRMRNTALNERQNNEGDGRNGFIQEKGNEHSESKAN